MSSSSPVEASKDVARSRSASPSSVETITRPTTKSSSMPISPTSDSFFDHANLPLDDSITELGHQTTALRSHLLTSLRKLEITRHNTNVQIAKIDIDIRAQEAVAKAHFVHRDTTRFEIDLEMMKSLLVVKGSLEMLLVALKGVEEYSGEDIEGMSGSELAVQLAKVTERIKIVVALDEELKEGGGTKKDEAREKKGVERNKNRESVWDWKLNEWEE